VPAVRVHSACAIGSDATQVGKWEFLRIVKCGDLGTDLQHTIIPANDQPLTAVKGGGLDQGDTISLGYWPGDTDDKSWSRFKFIRPPDGSYALQTANGVNFVIALNGGGEVQKYPPPNCGFPGACLSGVSTIFNTDATRVRSWERFKFVDQGDCR